MADADKGRIGIQGTSFCLIGADGVTKWKYDGTLIDKPAGAVAGRIWMSSLTGEIHYIDQTGNHRKLTKTTSTSIVGEIGAFNISGKIFRWIDQNKKLSYSHSDIAHTNISHTDSGHNSAGHNDVVTTPYSNTPFSDNHVNIPAHNNHTDGDHRDCSGYSDAGGNHTNDHSDDHANVIGHSDHSNTTFKDTAAHSDGYNDSGHGNHSSSPYQNAAHQDTPSPL